MKAKYYKCPYCLSKFTPDRTNQLFCSQVHGYTYRNQLKSSTDTEFVSRERAKVNNLKVLTRLCKESKSTFTKYEIPHTLNLAVLEDHTENYHHSDDVAFIGENFEYLIQFREDLLEIFQPYLLDPKETNPFDFFETRL